MPKSNRSYWKPKLLKNTERDKRSLKELRALKWKVLTIWECETKIPERLVRVLTKFL